ncbi:MAG: site-specific integrase, partial [Actinomycetota bacterium]|nr:site-specific integrase [Actinomycetota bacterium]
AANKQSQLLARLSAWLEDEGLKPAELATAQVERFFHARRAEGYANLLTSKSVAPLVKHLLRENVIAVPPPVMASGPTEAVLERFRMYLLHERGLVEGTARFYLHVARLLASERVRADGVDLAGLRAGEVTSFTARTCAERGLSSARQVVSALRTFLRFLVLEGVTDLALDQAVLSVAGWNPSLPRAISSADVARLLASCDRRSTIGRRDYAMLVLLSRLGLRGGEVVGLKLADIDWRSGEITVQIKGGRRSRLPMAVDVGEAIVAYLRRRPGSEDRRVFLRAQAPFRGFSGTGAIRGVLARACLRAGMAYVSPHRLRHTTATEMLRAGASLAEIGQVLGHVGAVSTAIYAKVDYDRLRALARPWPEVAA